MEPFIAHLHSYLVAGGLDTGEYLSRDIMRAIEGNGSARSYLDASFFTREIHEFGAMWHGADWSAHRLTERDPFTEGILMDGDGEGSHTKLEPADWTWKGKDPREWPPTVTMTERQSRVEFYTYSGLCWESLNFHRDTHTQGRYACRSTLRRIALGTEGYRLLTEPGPGIENDVPGSVRRS